MFGNWKYKTLCRVKNGRHLFYWIDSFHLFDVYNYEFSVYLHPTINPRNPWYIHFYSIPITSKPVLTIFKGLFLVFFLEKKQKVKKMRSLLSSLSRWITWIKNEFILEKKRKKTLKQSLFVCLLILLTVDWPLNKILPATVWVILERSSVFSKFIIDL